MGKRLKSEFFPSAHISLQSAVTAGAWAALQRIAAIAHHRQISFKMKPKQID
jgi:hypothetical protein